MEANLVFMFLGAAGAGLVTLAVLALDDLWKQTLLPLWRRWRYRGVNLSGGWKGLGSSPAIAAGEWTEVELTLEQQARELRGALWIRRCSAGRIAQLQVPLSGSVSAGCVTLAAASAGEAPAGHATALLKVDPRGSCLIGQLLYRDADTDGVEGIHLSVYRASSMALPRLRPLPALQAAVGGAA